MVWRRCGGDVAAVKDVEPGCAENATQCQIGGHVPTKNIRVVPSEYM